MLRLECVGANAGGSPDRTLGIRTRKKSETLLAAPGNTRDYTVPLVPDFRHRPDATFLTMVP